MSCVFCQILNTDSRILWVGAAAFAITPLNPVTPGHTLMISRRHVLHAGYDVKVTGDTFKAAAEYVQWMCLSDFNLITSAGSLATQTIGHLHVHIVPRRPGDGLHLPWTVS